MSNWLWRQLFMLWSAALAAKQTSFLVGTHGSALFAAAVAESPTALNDPYTPGFTLDIVQSNTIADETDVIVKQSSLSKDDVNDTTVYESSMGYYVEPLSDLTEVLKQQTNQSGLLILSEDEDIENNQTERPCGENFNVTINTRSALGVVLSGGLNITSFYRDSDGHSLPLELSGLVKVGDRLVSACNTDLRNAHLSDALEALTSSPYPCTLTFLPVDGRCVFLNSSTNATEGQADGELEEPNASPPGGKVQLFKGPFHQLSMQMWPAAFSASSSCTSLPLRIAKPLDACGTLDGGIEGSIVVAERGICDVYDKAMNIQVAGGKGLIVVSKRGWTPIRVEAPENAQANEVKIPVIMVGYTAGQALLNPGSAYSDPKIRIEVSGSDCGSTTSTNEQSSLETQAIPRGGSLIVGANHSLEFFTVAGGDRVPTQAMRIADINLCELAPNTKIQNTIVIDSSGQCRDIETHAATHGASILILVQPLNELLETIRAGPSSTFPDLNFFVMTPQTYATLSALLSIQDSGLLGKLQPSGGVTSAWVELDDLSNPGLWPPQERDRMRLYSRLLKAQDHGSTGDRLTYLERVYRKANDYFASRAI